MPPPPAEPMAYEELTSLYRKERGSNTLAELRRDFYSALAELLSRTQKEYEKELARDPDSIVCEGLNQRRKKMTDLAQRIIEDRMDKIASMALKGGEGYGNALERLTAEEKELYQRVLEDFRGHRGILPQLRKRDYRIGDLDVKATPPEPEPLPEAAAPIEGPAQAEETLPAEDPAQAEETLPAEDPAQAEEPLPAEEAPAPLLQEEESDNMVVRILEDLPTFSGPYRDYSLRKDDVVLMPRSLAEALVSREVAAEVRPRL